MLLPIGTRATGGAASAVSAGGGTAGTTAGGTAGTTGTGIGSSMREPPQPATTTSAATANLIIIYDTPESARRFRPCQRREHVFDSQRRDRRISTPARSYATWIRGTFGGQDMTKHGRSLLWL